MSVHYDFFIQMLKPDVLLADEPMKNHTSFKTGGPASLMILPQTSGQIADIISACITNGFKFIIIGNGSNLLFPDEGYDGIVIKLSKAYSCVSTSGDCKITAASGISLSALANFALDKHMSGLEFASGIPGTLGGAVYMNAGAYDSEIKDVIESADVLLSSDMTVKTFSRENMDFGYRKSIFQYNGGIVLSVNLTLNTGNYSDIKTKMDVFNNMRREKQPLEYPSAGSTFKRPEGCYAGKLIMDAGLSGYSAGGAQVSEKHCGFIINKAGATSADIKELITNVRQTVADKFGIILEPEVKIVE